MLLMARPSFQGGLCSPLVVWKLTFSMYVFLGKFLLFLLLILPGNMLICLLMQIVSLILFTNENYLLRLVFCFADVAGECESVEEEFVTLEKDVHECRQRIHNTKAMLQRVLECWATYEEDLQLLKTSFEATKKEQIKEVFEVQGTAPVFLFLFGDS